MSTLPGKRLLYIFTAAPHTTAQGQEGLDALLTGAAFELPISVLFLHDGVFQLKSGQVSADESNGLYTRTFGALADFGVDKLYVNEQSMQARGLQVSDCSVPVELLSNVETAALIQQQDRVFTC